MRIIIFLSFLILCSIGLSAQSPVKSNNAQTNVKETKVYDVVETMPTFPGGMGAVMKYLSENIQYPYPVPHENYGIDGRVICSFIVEPDGTLSNVKVSRSVDPLLDKEAVRVISSMPKWKPGRHEGKNVRVKYTLPVAFKVQ